jgi:cob(I)alamin adenosyltransferase
MDTLISLLGVCHAANDDPDLRAGLHRIQEELFVVGAELACDERGLLVLAALSIRRILTDWNKRSTAI